MPTQEENDAQLAALDAMIADLPTQKDHTVQFLLNSTSVEDATNRASSAWMTVTIKGTEFENTTYSSHRYDGKIRQHIDSGAISVNRKLFKQRICEGTGWSSSQVDSVYFKGKKVTDRHPFVLGFAAAQQRPMIVCGEGESYDRKKWADVPGVHDTGGCCSLQ
mmetsp:Transcript_19859/g.46180  ORF Transcript_19859/g.46180 Transcript_19859/m.46180 type:complete len:163 (+) Transcript_19859:75-563(+)